MRSIADTAARAESLSYDSVWVSDHIVIPEVATSKYPYGTFTVRSRACFYEPLITLAYVSAVTRTVRLGVSVLVLPLRDPVYMAKLVATLDALSKGRVILGAGAGWLREEFEALGFNAERFRDRGAIMEEWIAVLRALWSDNEVSRYSGRFVNVPPVRALPKPAQRPGPPIWIGGNSPAAIRRAVKLGDGWHAIRIGTTDFRAAAERLRRGLLRDGRESSRFALSLRCFVGGADAREDWELGGNAERAAKLIAAYARAGCDHFVLDVRPTPPSDSPLTTLEWFASCVRPLVNTEFR
jgi:probable F420-dependent oxidoreductase